MSKKHKTNDTKKMRKILYKELDDFNNEDINAEHVTSVTRVTNSICRTMMVDVEFFRLRGK